MNSVEFKKSVGASLQESDANILVNKGFIRIELEKPDEAIECYDDLILPENAR